jgi:hypothetical protein
MLYPLSYRRKARVVYRGEAAVATGVGRTCPCSVPGGTRKLLRPRGCLAEAVTGLEATPSSGRTSSLRRRRGDAASGGAIPSEERPLLEPQAGQDLFHARVGQRPDPRAQAGLLDRRDLRDDHEAPLGKAPFARVEQDVPRFARPVQIRRQRAHDHGRDARVVEDVVLNRHVGMGAGRHGPSRVVRPHPEHVAAVDPRRTCARRFSLVGFYALSRSRPEGYPVARRLVLLSCLSLSGRRGRLHRALFAGSPVDGLSQTFLHTGYR